MYVAAAATRLAVRMCVLIARGAGLVVGGALVSQVMLAFGDFMSVTCHACIGGKNVGEDMRILSTGNWIAAHTALVASGCCPPIFSDPTRAAFDDEGASGSGWWYDCG